MTTVITKSHQEIIIPKLISVGMCGYFRLQIRRPDGRVRWDSGFFANKVLDSGRNNMATQANWLSDCQVGTSSVTPTAVQTGLVEFVAGTDVIESIQSGSNGVAPYFGWKRITFRFAQGAALGNLSEVGVGWDKVAGANLVSRALIIDPVTQNPTTVSLLPDEVLDVTYEFRYYAPEEDIYGPQATLNGVVYDTITRPALATSSIWYQFIGSQIEEYSPFTSSWQAWSGELGTVTQTPSGTASNADTSNHYTLGYLNNSYEVVVGANLGSTGWNPPGGIRSIHIQTTAGAFQTRFGAVGTDATIPKDGNYVMVMRWLLNWVGQNLRSTWTKVVDSDVTMPLSGEWNKNIAGTILRINWLNSAGVDQRDNLRITSGSSFRIIDNIDRSKWVQYTVTGAHTEYTDWTEYPITEESIQNSGPTDGNLSIVMNVDA